MTHLFSQYRTTRSPKDVENLLTAHVCVAAAGYPISCKYGLFSKQNVLLKLTLSQSIERKLELRDPCFLELTHISIGTVQIFLE
jgi:hypothetical protein